MTLPVSLSEGGPAALTLGGKILSLSNQAVDCQIKALMGQDPPAGKCCVCCLLHGLLERRQRGVEAKSEASLVLLQGGADPECGGSPEQISPCVD